MWRKKEGLEIQIETGELEDTHPNTAEITLTAADGGKGVSSGQQYWRGEYLDHPGEWNGGCPYRAESCFDRASQGCTRDDCCGYRADGRVWGLNICNFPTWRRETKGRRSSK